MSMKKNGIKPTTGNELNINEPELLHIASTFLSKDDHAEARFRKRCCAVYGGWLLFGFVTGFHWLAFIPHTVFCMNSAKSYGSFSLKSIFLNMVVYWVSCITFWVLRQAMVPLYVPCSKEEDGTPMTCFFNEQDGRYIAAYVSHIALVIIVVTKWLYEALRLPAWLRVSDKLATERDTQFLAEFSPAIPL